MSVTRKELHVRTLARIDERYGSTAGALYNANDSGNPLRVDTDWSILTSGGTVLTTDQELDTYLNQAAQEWCKTAFYLEGMATLTWPTTAYSKRLNELTPAASQGNLHGIEAVTKTVSATTTALKKMTRDQLRNHNPAYRTTTVTPANLAYWAQDQSTVHLEAKPTATVDLTFYGPCYPQDLAASGGATSWSWMEDAELRSIIPCLTALLLIRRKFSDSNLFGRFEELAIQYNDFYTSYRSRLSPATLEEFYKGQEMDALVRRRGK